MSAAVRWIDTHCHLQATAFAADVDAVRTAARQHGVVACVLPAVHVADCTPLAALAQRHGDGYAVGIHPLYVPQAQEEDLDKLTQYIQDHLHDPHLVAIGEIGLDFHVPELCTDAMRTKQLHFYHAQLKLAQQFDLPVILHVRRAVDAILHGIRQWQPPSGIAHAFNGSMQQAQQALALGLKLGFGGAVTYSRAKRLQHLVCDLPIESLVLETDAPDMQSSWLYVSQTQRMQGVKMPRNTPAELPRIAQYIAQLRGDMPLAVLAQHTQTNAIKALAKLAALGIAA